MAEFRIADRIIGAGHPTFIVAELSANHGGALETALRTVDAAAAAGADAIKLQTYTADTLTLDCDTEPFRIRQGTLWDGKTLHQLYREAYTPWEWHEPLKRRAAEAGILFFSTPFDPTAVELLDRLGVPAYKIASFELNDIPLIAYAAARGRPMILSTGLSGLDEIGAAVQACRGAGNDAIALLKCTSAYPAAPHTLNLRMIPHLSETFGLVTGLSDHTCGGQTIGGTAAIVAVALGAAIIEKHFILDRSLGGPDASFSTEPAEFRSMVDAIRLTEAALGAVTFEVPAEVRRNLFFKRSLFVVRDMAAGEPFTAENVRSIRPAAGLPPGDLPRVLGRRAIRALPRGTPLAWDLIEG